MYPVPAFAIKISATKSLLVCSESILTGDGLRKNSIKVPAVIVTPLVIGLFRAIVVKPPVLAIPLIVVEAGIPVTLSLTSCPTTAFSIISASLKIN